MNKICSFKKHKEKRDFERSFEFTKKWEGGYVNDPDDPGGETNYGISKRSHPDLDIKNLTIDQAKKIYKKKYWDEADCSSFEWPINCALFDTAVNLGVFRAKGMLARSDYDLQRFLDFREKYYRNLATEKPKLKKFLNGWLNRLNDLRNFVEGA